MILLIGRGLMLLVVGAVCVARPEWLMPDPADDPLPREQRRVWTRVVGAPAIVLALALLAAGVAVLARLS